MSDIADPKSDAVVIMSRLNSVVMTQEERKQTEEDVLRILKTGEQRARAIYSEHYDEAEQHVIQVTTETSKSWNW